MANTSICYATSVRWTYVQSMESGNTFDFTGFGMTVKHRPMLPSSVSGVNYHVPTYRILATHLN